MSDLNVHKMEIHNITTSSRHLNDESKLAKFKAIFLASQPSSSQLIFCESEYSINENGVGR